MAKLQDSISNALQRTIRRTARNCLVLENNKLKVMRIPVGKEKNKKFDYKGKTLLRHEVGFDDDADEMDRLIVCTEEGEEQIAGVYLMLQVYADEGKEH